MRVSVPASVAKVPVVGNVRPVVPVVVNVRLLAPEKAIVVPFGIVNVPVVFVTFNPFTFFAFIAYGAAVNRIRDFLFFLEGIVANLVFVGHVVGLTRLFGSATCCVDVGHNAHRWDAIQTFGIGAHQSAKKRGVVPVNKEQHSREADATQDEHSFALAPGFGFCCRTHRFLS